MEMVESSSQQVEHHQVPLGGPIYHQDLVGPLTRVPDFETAVVTELESLITELNTDDSSSSSTVSYLSQLLFGEDDGDDDLSVDDLKIFSEEDLVQKALKEAFPENQETSTAAAAEAEAEAEGENDSNNNCLETQELAAENSKSKRKGRPPKGTFVKRTKRSNKRGRTFDRDTRAAELENTAFIEKVEHLARIKQRQDEDKLAARLHSFNGGLKPVLSEKEKDAKMTSLRCEMRKPAIALGHVPITYPEVVLSVEVCKNKMWTKTHEFLVLGSQRLTELRDKIYCLTDHLMHEDVKRKQKEEDKEAQFDSSGYFLIEDVFCNDMRDPSAIDYSEPILDWLRTSKDEALAKWESILSGELQQKQRALLGQSSTPPLPQFRAVEMHNIRFCDLSFRLGAGYLYCHQGDCRHHIVIRDMRLIHKEDVQNRASYPIKIYQLKTRHRKCSVCKIYRAKKFTVDDKWAEENPCYFCDNCYYFFHYAEDNGKGNDNLLYSDFTVYDYHHE